MSVGIYRPLWYRLAGSDRRTATGTGQLSKVFRPASVPLWWVLLWTPVHLRHERDWSSFSGLVRTQVGRNRSKLSMGPAKGWAKRPTESLQHRAIAWWHWKRCGGTATDWVPCGRLNPAKGTMALCTVGPVRGWFIPSTAIDKGITEKVDRPESMAPCARGLSTGRHGGKALEVQRTDGFNGRPQTE